MIRNRHIRIAYRQSSPRAHACALFGERAIASRPTDNSYLFQLRLRPDLHARQRSLEFAAPSRGRTRWAVASSFTSLRRFPRSDQTSPPACNPCTRRDTAGRVSGRCRRGRGWRPGSSGSGRTSRGCTCSRRARSFATTGMNQASLAVRKSGRGLREIGRAVARQLVAVDAVAVDVAHVELFAILRRIGVGVEPADAAVGRLLMAVLDDGADLPGVTADTGRPADGSSRSR